MNYVELTKEIEDKDKGNIVVCVGYGTHMCRIHKDGTRDCASCPVFEAILNQLRCFESIMIEED